MALPSSPDPEEAEEFSLLTSIRGDISFFATYGQQEAECMANPYPLQTGRTDFTSFHMRDLHRDRLLAAARDFDWPDVISYLEGTNGLHKFEAALIDALIKIYDGTTWPRDVKVRRGFPLLKATW